MHLGVIHTHWSPVKVIGFGVPNMLSVNVPPLFIEREIMVLIAIQFPSLKWPLVLTTVPAGLWQREK